MRRKIWKTDKIQIDTQLFSVYLSLWIGALVFIVFSLRARFCAIFRMQSFEHFSKFMMFGSATYASSSSSLSHI